MAEITSVLPLEDVVQIIVNLSPRSAVRNAFNLALLVGTSDVISPEERVKVYSGTESMLRDGFTDDMPEYKMANLFLNQRSSPPKVAIGRWDDTGEETLLQAVRACRVKNRDWYLHIPLGATSENILTLAEYIESVKPVAALFYTTRDIELMQNLKKLNYRRTFGQYSEKYDNAVVGIAGWAMGANTGLTNSAYTLAYKTLVGMEVDDLDENLVQQLKEANGNYYVNRGSQYDVFEQGTMADGVWFDEIINLDMLVNDLQLAIMDLLRSVKKVPQVEEGVNMIINIMKDPLEKSVRTGFVAGGIWKGPELLNLHYGDAIERGYLIQTEAVGQQSQADRDARWAPPIYVALKLAGAIHHVVVQIDVNR